MEYLNNLAKTGAKRDILAFLERGGDVNAKVDRDGRSLLETATYTGNTDVVLVLLSNRADVKTIGPNRRGLRLDYTLLHYAAFGNYVDIAMYLLKFGMNKNARDKGNNGLLENWNTPLIEAIAHGSTEVAYLLLDNHADPTILNKYGFGPLYKAVQWQDCQMISDLLTINPDLHKDSDRDGMTPLHVAASNGSLDVVKLLLTWTANPIVRDMDDKSAFDYAVENGHTGVVEVIHEVLMRRRGG
jgi:ankyrin repeat protein